MTISYDLYKVEKKEVCIPSTDFYARKGDTYNDEITVLSFINSFSSYDQAVNFLKDNESSYKNANYTILPIIKL